ncbi:MAG TPA: hypothetical protein VKU91_02595, partial [Acidimicrobiales bacterium]|nr:hypothetical protein [Acidimicrobiales bacterium]
VATPDRPSSGPAPGAPARPGAGGPGSGPTREAAGDSPSPVARPSTAAPATARRGAAGADDSLTLEELVAASGLPAGGVADLQEYGLIGASKVGGVWYYDDDALAVARAAAGFARHGVEARHLRAWRNAADREASLFEQVVVPLLRQRNPEARQQAVTTLEELTAAGSELHAALLRRALRSIR